jgi:hypothetical protein
MKDYSHWLDSAAEEALSTSIQSSMDICSQIRQDNDSKKDLDHDKIESLQYCWQGIREIVDTAEPDTNEMKTVKSKTAALQKKNVYNTSAGKFIVSAPPKVNPNDYVTAKTR